VFVGVNGAGKTSVLEGLVKLLSISICNLYESSYDVSNFKQYGHHIIDVKRGKIVSENALLIKANKNLFKIRLKILNDSTIGSEYSFELLQGENQVISLDTVLYYPTDRAVPNFPNLKTIDLSKLKTTDSLIDLLDNNISFDNFFSWFRSLEDFENEQIRFTDNSKYRSKELEAVRKAISIFLPNFSNPRVQRQPQEELIVEKNGEKLSISNLSHGERLMFAMVGDMARRLSIANPSLEDPLQGEGVVLIDEIELHLHPGWQRKIVPLLTKTFPNIQFILTTHSPQVISSVERESVFVLKNFKLIESPFTLGRDTNSLLHDVFQEEERPNWAKEKLEKFYDLLEKEEIENAEKVLDELREAFGNGDSEIQRAEVHLSLIAD